jgi:hypothetical protein
MKIIKIIIAILLFSQYSVTLINAEEAEEKERQIKKDEIRKKGITKDYSGLNILKKDINENQIDEDSLYLLLLEYGIGKKEKDTIKAELNKRLERAVEFNKNNKIYYYIKAEKVDEIKVSCIRIWEKYCKLFNEGLEQKKAMHIAVNWFSTKYKD